MFQEAKHAKHAQPPKDDNIKDGTEDANHNGRIDGDNGDGKWSESEVWIELDPNEEDTDGDTFNDDDEIDWGYNPMSSDTDGDGLDDNEEDTSNLGTWDSSTETNVKESDTDRDGLSDGMELDGWTVVIIYEATLEIIEERKVTSDPLLSDYDEDGITDCGEFENGTDPNDVDTDDDGISDIQEIKSNIGSSPFGIDGKPPIVTSFDYDYELRTYMDGIKLVSKYYLNIELSIEDPFYVEWINVHIKDVGDSNLNCHDKVLNDVSFEFILSINQAVRSLFDDFKINITSMDSNRNTGYREESTTSILNIILESIIGEMISIVNKISSICLIYVDYLKSIISDIIMKSLMIDIINFSIDQLDRVMSVLTYIANIVFTCKDYIDLFYRFCCDQISSIFTKIFNNFFGIELISNEFLQIDFINELIDGIIGFLPKVVNEISNFFVNEILKIDINIKSSSIVLLIGDIIDIFNNVVGNGILNYIVYPPADDPYDRVTPIVDFLKMPLDDKILHLEGEIEEIEEAENSTVYDILMNYFVFTASLLGIIIDFVNVGIEFAITLATFCIGFVEPVVWIATLVHFILMIINVAVLIIDCKTLVACWGHWLDKINPCNLALDALFGFTIQFFSFIQFILTWKSNIGRHSSLLNDYKYAFLIPFICLIVEVFSTVVSYIAGRKMIEFWDMPNGLILYAIAGILCDVYIVFMGFVYCMMKTLKVLYTDLLKILRAYRIISDYISLIREYDINIIDIIVDNIPINANIYNSCKLYI